jgi:peptide/nickel transport system substrate-binding protein
MAFASTTVPTSRAAWLRITLATAFAGSALLAMPLHAQTLTVVMASKLTVLDPVLTAAHQTRNHAYMIYDTLIATDAQQKLQPQMLQKWDKSADGKTYTFTLRDGLAWHDGVAVKAEDCVASLKRWAAQDKVARLVWPMVTSVDVIDDKQFKIVLSEPTDALLEAIGKPSGLPAFMMPKRVADTPPTQPITDYTGSGPFKFAAADFRPGVKAVYLKNAAYVPRQEPASWTAGGKVVGVDRVEWIAMPDSTTAVNALINREVDYVETVPFDLLPLVKGQDGVELRTLDKLGYQPMYRFNQLNPPFNDKRVRQAAMYAVGQEDILRAQVGDPEYYKVCGAAFGCGLPFESTQNSEMITKVDLVKAKQLLKDANYDGEPITILQATDIAMASAIPVVMAQQLRQAGFKVNLQPMDFMTMLSRRANRDVPAKGGWSIFVTTWHNTEIQDPLRNYGVSANGEKAWFGWPNVPELESLRDQFVRTTGDAERKQLAGKIQGVMFDEGVAMTLGSIHTAAAYRKTLTGVLESPVPVFWNIKKAAK